MRKVPAKGSKKGCMRGKGGLENSNCEYRGVRQRTWGKWVAEIREPKKGCRLWLGTYDTSFDAALAYDKAARAMYGSYARVNLPESVLDLGDHVDLQECNMSIQDAHANLSQCKRAKSETFESTTTSATMLESDDLKPEAVKEIKSIASQPCCSEDPSSMNSEKPNLAEDSVEKRGFHVPSSASNLQCPNTVEEADTGLWSSDQMDYGFPLDPSFFSDLP